MILTGE